MSIEPLDRDGQPHPRRTDVYDRVGYNANEDPTVWYDGLGDSVVAVHLEALCYVCRVLRIRNLGNDFKFTINGMNMTALEGGTMVIDMYVGVGADIYDAVYQRDAYGVWESGLQEVFEAHGDPWSLLDLETPRYLSWNYIVHQTDEFEFRITSTYGFLLKRVENSKLRLLDSPVCVVRRDDERHCFECPYCRTLDESIVAR